MDKLEKILTELLNQQDYEAFKKYVDKLTGNELIFISGIINDSQIKKETIMLKDSKNGLS